MSLQDHERLGPYEILGSLGAGGMGEVYRAVDTRLDRTVAIKILPRHQSERPGSRARFEREAKAISSLSHPNICTLYDVGREGELNFLVMEHLEGETLSTRLLRGPLPVDEAISHASEIASALEEAHRQQIIHRDLKPSNIMLTEHGVKLIDFGLAKLLETDDPSDARDSGTATTAVSRPGTAIGTLRYMSPEQAAGDAVDEKTDLFSFGVILYEMVVGRPPFLRSTSSETIAAILNAPTPQFPVRLDPGGGLGHILRACLEKSPARRLASAEQLLRALNTYRRSLALRADSADEPSIAVLPFLDMSASKDQDYLCEGIAEELIFALGRIPSLHVAARTSTFQFKNRAGDVREIGRALGVRTLLEGSVRTSGQQLRITASLVDAENGYELWAEKFERALGEVFAVQDEIAAKVVNSLRGRLDDLSPAVRQQGTRSVQAYQLYLKGRQFWYQRYGGGFRKALELFDAAAREDPRYALPHAGTANTYCMLGLYGFLSPEVAAPRAIGASEEALASGSERPECLAARALTSLFFQWDGTAAMELLSRAIERNPQFVEGHAFIGFVFSAMGELQRASDSAARATAADPFSPYAHVIEGLVLGTGASREAASDRCHEALALDPDYLVSLYAFGVIESVLGRHVRALEALEKASRQSERAVFYRALLGWARANAGDVDGAVAIAHELEERAEVDYVAPAFLALVYGAMGRLDEAFDLLDRAYEERQPLLVFHSWPVFDCLRSDARFSRLVARIRPFAAPPGSKPGT